MTTHKVQNTGTYDYTVVALKFIEASRGGRTLVDRTPLLGSRVEGVEVAVINVLTGKDISEEF
jgi:hypothetical protein